MLPVGFALACFRSGLSGAVLGGLVVDVGFRFLGGSRPGGGLGWAYGWLWFGCDCVCFST